MGMNEFESYNKRANLWFYDAQRSDVTNFSHYKKKLKLGCMIFKFFSSSQVTIKPSVLFVFLIIFFLSQDVNIQIYPSRWLIPFFFMRNMKLTLRNYSAENSRVITRNNIRRHIASYKISQSYKVTYTASHS